MVHQNVSTEYIKILKHVRNVIYYIKSACLHIYMVIFFGNNDNEFLCRLKMNILDI